MEKGAFRVRVQGVTKESDTTQQLNDKNNIKNPSFSCVSNSKVYVQILMWISPESGMDGTPAVNLRTPLCCVSKMQCWNRHRTTSHSKGWDVNGKWIIGLKEVQSPRAHRGRQSGHADVGIPLSKYSELAPSPHGFSGQAHFVAFMCWHSMPVTLLS